jgi:hypothetical protein
MPFFLGNKIGIQCALSQCYRKALTFFPQNPIPRQDSNPGANPTTSSHKASVLKIYNAMSSLLRLEKKIILL